METTGTIHASPSGAAPVFDSLASRYTVSTTPASFCDRSEALIAGTRIPAPRLGVNYDTSASTCGGCVSFERHADETLVRGLTA